MHSINYRVKNLGKTIRFFRILLFAFMLAVCMFFGVAPVIPKRKEQFSVEIKMEEAEKEEDTLTKVNLFRADS
jgi:hypothetical protein